MSEPGTLPSILENGLLSTSTLLNLFEINGEARRRLESQVRRQSQIISHPKFGSAVVRDQKPIVNEERLRKCVQGATPEEWLRLLNSKVFFWVNRARLRARLSWTPTLGAHIRYAKARHRLPAIDHPLSRELGKLPAYPHPRSPACFASIQDFDYAGWRKRGQSLGLLTYRRETAAAKERWHGRFESDFGRQCTPDGTRVPFTTSPVGDRDPGSGGRPLPKQRRLPMRRAFDHHHPHHRPRDAEARAVPSRSARPGSRR